MFKQIKNFLWICLFSNMVRKTKFLCISMLVSEIALLCLKRKVLYEFPPKCFKTWERYGIALCGSLCGEKKFLLIFIPFYRFDQKQLFIEIQIFLWIFPFSNMVRKTNFLSISVLVYEIIPFLTKKSSSLWISPKMLQNMRKVWYSTIWLTLWRKKVFVNIYPLWQVWSKKVV